MLPPETLPPGDPSGGVVYLRNEILSLYVLLIFHNKLYIYIYIYILGTGFWTAVPWLRRLAAGLLLRRPSFSPRPAHLGFVENTATLGQVPSEYSGLPCQYHATNIPHPFIHPSTTLKNLSSWQKSLKNTLKNTHWTVCQSVSRFIPAWKREYA